MIRRSHRIRFRSTDAMFLLDTNIVIPILNERDPQAAQRLDEELVLGTPILMSTIVVFELRYGIARSARRERNQAALVHFMTLPLTVVPFDDDDATHAGDIRTHLERNGTPVGAYDVLIAAQARRRGAVLVTRNRREFDRVPGLMVTDWT
jgi:tRNA(fMet)-specific endonuclease VapC